MAKDQAWLAAMTPPRDWKSAGAWADQGVSRSSSTSALLEASRSFSSSWVSYQSFPDTGPRGILLLPDLNHPSLNSSRVFHIWTCRGLHSLGNPPRLVGSQQRIFTMTFQ